MFKNFSFDFFKGNTKPSKVNKGKPYQFIKMVNNNITIVLVSGVTISRQEVDKAFYQKIEACKTEEQIIDLMFPKDTRNKYNNQGQGVTDAELQMKEEREQVISEVAKRHFEDFKNLKEFKVELDGRVFLSGIDRSLPPQLVKHFINVIARCKQDNVDYTIDKEFLSLKRFFLWACLNPRPEVADKLYGFLSHNVMRLTSQGLFVALRNVVTVQETKSELVDFVSNAYNKIKAVWKADPNDYAVVKTGDTYHFIEVADYLEEGHLDDSIEYLGTIKQLYFNLPNEVGNRYTDAHTGKFDIRVGKRVSMDPKNCDWSTVDCGSGGLHGTLNEVYYVGCGDTTVVMLVNPMKVVGIGTQKFRCWEYFPIMTVSRSEATRILYDLDFDTLELDEVYVEEEVKNLEEKVRANAPKEGKAYSFDPNYSVNAQRAIKQLEAIKSEIKSKVVQLS